MTNEPASKWQNLPTVVELTEDGIKKKQSAARMAEMLDDVLDTPGIDDLAPKPLPKGGWSVETLVRDFRFGGEEVPTLVRSAAPLLNLAHALRYTDEQPDMEQLRRVAVEAVGRYERDLAGSRISPERARAAHYIICATVDDVVLSKPWGVRAGWARSGLVSTFHMDVTGGDRVFDLLDHFHQSPGANKDLLLLIYLSLSLAFEGRTRVSARGNLELGRIRDSLYKTLLGQYGVFERELSPHWKGVSAKHKPLRTAVALWTLLSLLALVFALGYLFFTFSLNNASDNTFQQLAQLSPADAPSILINPPPPEAPPKIIAEIKAPPVKPELVPAKPTKLENFMRFLQPEVEQNLVSLRETAKNRVLVRINNAGLFDVGSAEVSDEFNLLIARIGGALAQENFRAVVVGYTDNVPIKTIQFPSNWHLSQARAKSVADILAAFTGPGAIIAEGRGEADPIASNSTPEGREKNRRTEILVLADPEEELTGAGATSPPLEVDIRNMPVNPAAGGLSP
ncbi:type VI secretion system protein TssL [Rhizobiales bacterium RZME27]|uniref:Type VI secretion system protein TssL n=1 Tax=Endobacterium cereale TaxID=2663029 RepID=A0A6A8ABC5_9HYPH|nr:type VI secretion system protein TssL, long form [Endobacterium cereale]MEB2844180.1 type VI secretion system protein TssL, long form [Endobacterium cereale]MQY48593.1 type VI secretion system protein TssL [Endobacterium cereale]